MGADEYELNVDPEMLVVATMAKPNGTINLVALSCSYVPITQLGASRAMAIEVIYDPLNQTPVVPYCCPANQLSSLVVPPKALLHVRPYDPTECVRLAEEQQRRFAAENPER